MKCPYCKEPLIAKQVNLPIPNAMNQVQALICDKCETFISLYIDYSSIRQRLLHIDEVVSQR